MVVIPFERSKWILIGRAYWWAVVAIVLDHQHVEQVLQPTS